MIPNDAPEKSETSAPLTRAEVEDWRLLLKVYFPNKSRARHMFNRICDQATRSFQSETAAHSPASASSVPEGIWRATCGVCSSTFEHNARPQEASLRAGTFCPECRANKRMVLGVLHWELAATPLPESKKSETFKLNKMAVERDSAGE